MSPYTVFPTFSFLQRVYKDGFRLIVYKAKKDINPTITYKLFPYEAIFEEDSYIKFRTMQNPSNYVLYYGDKFLRDERYVIRRNDTLKANSSLTKCKVYDFNIDDLKLDLLKVNCFDIKQISGSIDDLWVGVYFDRNDDTMRYDLCKRLYNGRVIRADKSIYTKVDDTRYMTMTIENKFAVKLEYLDAYECYKSKTDSKKYMEIKRAINKIALRREDRDWISDDRKAFVELVHSGIPKDFIYKNAMNENIVFLVEDIYRTADSNSTVFGPIYKTYLD